MNVNKFIPLFVKKIIELDKLELIIPDLSSSKISYSYGAGDWTYLVNCSIFEVVRELQESDVGIIIEKNSKAKGRGAFSDFTLTSINNDNLDYIEIEHENSPEANKKGKFWLDWCIEKLSRSEAKQKLLITYYSEKLPKPQLVEEAKNSAIKHFTQQGKSELYLLYGNWYWDKLDEKHFDFIKLA